MKKKKTKTCLNNININYLFDIIYYYVHIIQKKEPQPRQRWHRNAWDIFVKSFAFYLLMDFKLND